MNNLTSKPFNIEKLHTNHINQLITLSKAVGWDYDHDEISTIMKTGTIVGCKDSSQNIIASAAIIPYGGGSLTSIGMVIVHPQYRGFGLGRRVTDACLHLNKESCPTMLIATEEGKPLYQKMGFKEVGQVRKYTANQVMHKSNIVHNATLIRGIDENDFATIVEIDACAFGAKRSTFLTERLNQSVIGLVSLNKDRQITGYGMVIETPANLIIGPIVSSTAEEAIMLINKLVENRNGPVRIDMPQYNQLVNDHLLLIGFSEVAQPPIMMLHSDGLPQRNGNLYAVAAQIFG